ncbi:unnamed protein product [Polarella glacialis]|uniref:RRM domain-containing protein n=1 Tax=Polarella glacialis TaxID=89957 RepID=A0A813E638_POLGL|nr:unnamed protein product [Polarella glacialis]
MYRADEGRLWIGNLSESAISHEIEDLFRPFGKVQSVRIKVRKPSFPGDANSFGFVNVGCDFKRDDAVRAVSCRIYQGKPLKVEDNTQLTENTRDVGSGGRAEDSRALFLRSQASSKARSTSRSGCGTSQSTPRSRRKSGGSRRSGSRGGRRSPVGGERSRSRSRPRRR